MKLTKQDLIVSNTFSEAMLRLIEKELSGETVRHLESLQAQIDDPLLSFEQKVGLADRLWKNKTGSKAGNAAFKEIKDRLVEMCVGHGLCNYCEHNEASDIEHIAPKSLFPALTFVWDNYILACKLCNTGFKIDEMYVFPDNESAAPVKVRRGTEPPHTKIAFLQPRQEEPMNFMELSICTVGEVEQDFQFSPRDPHVPGTQGFEKVKCTLEILTMNEKRSLHRLREEEFKNYVRRLKTYVAVKLATNFEELNHSTTIHPQADPRKDFALEKDRILQVLREDIAKASHPTIWHEMIRQQARMPKIQTLFDQAPELVAATIRA